jgi:hypothetical protein
MSGVAKSKTIPHSGLPKDHRLYVSLVLKIIGLRWQKDLERQKRRIAGALVDALTNGHINLIVAAN